MSKDIEKIINQLTEQGYLDAQSAFNHQYLAMLQKGEFSSAVEIIEQDLSIEPNKAEHRLWWVHCQLHLSRVPITALTVVLDEIKDSLRENTKLQSIAAATFLKAASTLYSKTHLRLTIPMMELCWSFLSGNKNQPESIIQVIRDFFINTLKEEIQRATIRKENAKYIDKLSAKLKELQTKNKKSFNEKNNSFPKTEAVVNKTDFISSKTILAHSIDLEKKNGITDKSLESNSMASSSQLLDQSELDSAIIDTGEFSVKKKQKKRLDFAPILIVMILLIGSYSTYKIIKNGILPDSNEEMKLAMSIYISEKDIPLSFGGIPSTLKLSPRVNSSLDDLNKRLLSIPSNKSSKNEKITEIDTTALDIKNASSIKPPIKTTDELESIEQLPQARNDIDENKVPYIDPNKLAQTQVEEVESSPQKTAVSSQSEQQQSSENKNSKIKKTAKEIENIVSKIENKTKDNLIPSDRINQFSKPRRYRTITETEVFSAPSLMADSLAHLEANTPIEVTARMGKWLELRSTTERVGYIYSEDAKQENK